MSTPAATLPAPPSAQHWARVLQRGRLHLILLLLMLPTLLGKALFTYVPNLQTVYYSFFNWDYSTTQDWVGWGNYIEALTTDKYFWPTFYLVLILFAANLVKMWPSIFTAIVLHRIRSERWQYLYRVLFVVPMVIPELVWLLVWKSFYNPTVGLLNSFLNATGLMALLRWLDSAMPAAAQALAPFRDQVIDPLFGNPWGVGVIGAALLLAAPGLRTAPSRLLLWTALGIVALWAWIAVPWPVVLGLPIALVLAQVLASTAGPRGQTISKAIGVVLLALAALLVLFTMVWTEPTNAFDTGRPAWLGNSKLIIPAVILWGFPWVGTVGVLIYLAGLQNISQDVYEAAELDGVGPFGRFWYIELPLVMTQVRINLIFMTIGTLTGYGLFYILLGADGGPGSVGMVPGLYMFREGFVGQRYGYACALGMILFVIVLAITILYQKYVKVEK